jgi:hypothetical protein
MPCAGISLAEVKEDRLEAMSKPKEKRSAQLEKPPPTMQERLQTK